MGIQDTLKLGLDAVIIGLFLTASFTDIRAFRIPNWISLAIIGLCFVRVGVDISFDISHTLDIIKLLLWDFVPAILVLLVGFALYAVSWFGAGDVKLMFAGTLWFGLAKTPFMGDEIVGAMAFVLMTMLFGGALAILIVIGQKIRSLLPAVNALKWLDSYKTYMPYGLAITAAALILIFQKIISIVTMV